MSHTEAESRKVDCKICGKPFSTSLRAIKNGLKFGHTLQEYCSDCQKKHKEAISTLPVSYFTTRFAYGKSLSDLVPGPLGKIYHPPRPHTLIKTHMELLDHNFGVTPEDIEEVYRFFLDPNHRVLVLIGSTGSGKSTAFVSWMMYPPDSIPEDFFTQHGQINITQPRIVAVDGTATFIGRLTGSDVEAGGAVGKSHSKEKATDWRNLAVPRTDGQIMGLIENGGLTKIGILMIDEAHERSENIDKILRAMKDQLPLYPHLRLIIASATIDEEEFLKEYGDMAGVITFQGYKPYDYQEYYQDEENKLPYDDLSSLKKVIVPKTVDVTTQLVEEILNGKTKGDILVFLHGNKEIEEAASQLKSNFRKLDKKGFKLPVYTLSRDSDEDHKHMLMELHEDPSSIRVIVSTNIAEASVTIDTLGYVVESGVAKVKQWDSNTNTTSVPMSLISKAQARQRWGRSGRTRDGEVICLYTKEQFDTLFEEQPQPAISRSDPASLLLDARAIGITNLTDGWVTNPDTSHVENAIEEFKKVGALDENGSITDYGHLLRRFDDYPAKVVDALLTADKTGCLIEFATLLPILKNGGKKFLLKWNRKWDAQTKRRAYQTHQSLMSSCKDDIDFLTVIFSMWNDNIAKPTQYYTEAHRLAVANQFFLDHNSLTQVAEERAEILKTLSAGKKDSNIRALNLAVLPRLKLLLAFFFGDDNLGIEDDVYQYRPNLEAKDNSLLSFRMAIPEDVQGILDQGIDLKDPISAAFVQKQLRLNSEPLEILLTRYFAPFFIPKGLTYQVVVNTVDSDFLSVSLTSAKSHLITSLEGFKDQVDEIDEEQGEVDEETLGDKKNTQQSIEALPFETILSNFKINNESVQFFVPAGQFPEAQENYQFLASVSSHIALDNGITQVLLNRVPEIDPFVAFSEIHQVGDQVEITSTETLIYPNDHDSALVAIEESSKLEILMDNEDLAFTYTNEVVKFVPLGIKFKAWITDIDFERQIVKANVLPNTQQAQRELIAKSSDRRGYSNIGAMVIDIRKEKEQLQLLLDWSRPEEVLLFTATVFHNLLTKDINEYQIGEKVVVQFNPDKDPKRFGLDNLPSIVEKQIGKSNITNNLDWDGTMLRYKGQMNKDQMLGLIELDPDPRWHLAIRQLYRKTNAFVGTKLIPQETVDSVTSKYAPGMKVQVRVHEIRSSGVIVQIDSELKGFIHDSSLPSHLKNLGAEFVAQIESIDLGSMEARLNANLQENSNIHKYEVGLRTQVTITYFNKGGAKAQTPDGVKCFIPKSLLPAKYTEVGTSLTAIVTSIDLSRDELTLTATLPEDNPLSRYSIGELINVRLDSFVKGGASVSTSFGDRGFIPGRLVPFHLKEENSVFMAKVEQVNPTTNTLVLNAEGLPENDIRNYLVIGKELQGEVIEHTSYGVDVRILAQKKGQIGNSDLPSNYRNLLKVGTKITVVVKQINHKGYVDLLYKPKTKGFFESLFG